MDEIIDILERLADWDGQDYGKGKYFLTFTQ